MRNVEKKQKYFHIEQTTSSSQKNKVKKKIVK